MAKDWTEENLDAQIQTELTSGEYWEIQADMWRNKYLDASDEIERLRKEKQKLALDFIASEGEWCELIDKRNKQIKLFRAVLTNFCDAFEPHMHQKRCQICSAVYYEARDALKEKE